MPKNFIQTTSFMHIPVPEFEAAVAFFRDLLGFQEYIHLRDSDIWSVKAVAFASGDAKI
jgi:hypothetical protein